MLVESWQLPIRLLGGHEYLGRQGIRVTMLSTAYQILAIVIGVIDSAFHDEIHRRPDRQISV